ncbi:hypothetical protein XENOCAPTIV_002100, partial [Xenoophorus captivus]
RCLLSSYLTPCCSFIGISIITIYVQVQLILKNCENSLFSDQKQTKQIVNLHINCCSAERKEETFSLECLHVNSPQLTFHIGVTEGEEGRTYRSSPGKHTVAQNTA